MLSAAFACVVLASCMTDSSVSGSALTGTATYRERIALPPQAVFEATLEDVSRADTASETIGRARIESPGNPPIRFSIAYDPARIEPARQYAVRGRITVGDQLLFVTDQSHPVLTRGHASQVELLLRRAGANVQGATRAIGTDAPGTTRMRGLYSYFADAGWFVDCASGQALPVAQERGNAALEAAYGRARSAPGEKVLATVDGRVETRAPMEGAPASTLVVERFIDIDPAANCARGTADASGPSNALIENTYWKLVRLGSTPVEVAERQREPHFILHPDQKRVSGYGGCNRLVGSYSVTDNRITFTQMAGTMMACPDGMEHEKQFHEALEKAQQWRIEDERLELLDSAGELLAQFESRYME